MEISKYNEAIIEAFKRGYVVDLKGNCFSPKGILIGNYINKYGYKTFGIRFEGKVYSLLVHRLQAYQKFKEDVFKEDVEVRHKNNIKLDNSFDNILIGSHSQNMMDKEELDRLNCAIYASSFMAKHDHKSIILDRNNGMSYKDLMKKHSISSKGTLSFIINSSLLKKAS